MARLGSSLSVFGVARFGSLFSLSVMEVTNLGSSLSLRSFARLGSSVSVLDELNMGSSLSLRSVARLGSRLSLFNCARFGKSLSVLDAGHFGSSMSIRGCTRLGSGLSIFNTLRLNGADTDGVNKFLTFSNADTYIAQGSSKLEVWVNTGKSATFESDGGILHGSWNVESSLVTSDRRLKTNIMPLQRTLREVVAPRGEKKAPTGIAGVPSPSQSIGAKNAASDGALWLLRQLRPVSYSFRKGMDSKFMRFGFIADELESVIPEVVRRPGDRDVEDQKAVVYQDLIALIAAATQSQQKLIETQQARVAQLEEMQQKMMQKIMALEEAKAEEEKNAKDKKKKLRSKKKKKRASSV